MKIGILVWQLDIKGGTQRQALELARFLSKSGHRIVVYAYVFDREQCYAHLCEGLSIKYVKLHKDIDKADYPITKGEYLYKYFMFFLGKKHRELLQILDADIDILNPHDHGTYVTAGLWQKKFRKPVVWMMNDMPLYNWNLNHIPKTIGYHVRPQYRHYISRFDEIVVLDNLNKRHVKENFHREAKVIRSGLDIEKFTFTPRPHKKDCKILMTSVLYPHRKVEDAARALRILVDKGYDVAIEHVGTLVRDPKYTKRILRLVDRLRLNDRFNFNGSVSEKELTLFFQNLDVYLFPNSPQTWGLSVFEAMTAGMPVVLTSGCGASEVLTDHENALITPPDSPQALAQAIEELIKEKGLKEKIIRNARTFVEDNISWEKYSLAMLEVFKKYAKA